MENLYTACTVEHVKVDNPYEVDVPEMPWYLRENAMKAYRKVESAVRKESSYINRYEEPMRRR